jgi:hypothetical protein
LTFSHTSGAMSAGPSDEPQLALPLPPLVPQPLCSAISCMICSSGAGDERLMGLNVLL